MNLFWIGIGIIGVFQVSMGMCAYYVYDPKVVTIVGNCALPVLAALMVMFINHVKRQLALLTEDTKP